MTGLDILWLLIGPQWSQPGLFPWDQLTRPPSDLWACCLCKLTLNNSIPVNSWYFASQTPREIKQPRWCICQAAQIFSLFFAQRCQGQNNYGCNAVLMALLSSDGGAAFYPATSLAFTGFTVDVWNAFCMLRLLKTGWRRRWRAVSLPLSFDNRTECFCGELQANGTK